MLNKNKLDDWYKRFQTKIKSENKKELLYIINKDFFNSSSNKQNLNAKILKRSNNKNKSNIDKITNCKKKNENSKIKRKKCISSLK